MKRRLLNLFAVLSLALWIATWIAWFRSYWTADEFRSAAAHVYVVLIHDSGSVRIDCCTGFPSRLPFAHQSRLPNVLGFYNPDSFFWSQPAIETNGKTTRIALSSDGAIESEFHRTLWSLRDVAPVLYPIQVTLQRHVVRLHDSWLAAAFSVLPLLWLVRRLGSRRVPGCCKRCGYDLRATPRRCPECGAVPVGANS